MCGCSCHAPSSCWLLWAGLGQQQRAAASPAAAGASPAASRQPQSQTCTRPTPTAPAESPQKPALFLPHSSAPLHLGLSKARFGGDASPSRAPRCACTLAVTCEAGEQRFRCVRGVRAQLAGSGYTKLLLPAGAISRNYCSNPPTCC